MNIESFIQPKNVYEQAYERAERLTQEFIGDYEYAVSPETIQAIPNTTKAIQETITTSWGHASEATKSVRYDKYKKSFMIGNHRATAGEIIASRHWGELLTFPPELDSSLAGKKLRREALIYSTLDRITTLVNHEMATNLEASYTTKDVMKSQAFASIRERNQEGAQSEQLGIFAETMIQGTLERIAIDYEHIGLEVLPGNAGQDVLEKIDFVISSKQKKRGVNVETEDPLYDEKHIGVQFTTNTQKRLFKQEQILKAKARGVAVDDIIYVALDGKALVAAIEQWKKAGKPLQGPWQYLDESTRKGVLAELLESVINEEQLNSVLKGV